MTSLSRNIACLLALILAGAGLGTAGAETAAPTSSSAAFARPRVDIPLQARLRGDRVLWSPGLRAAVEEQTLATNEGGFLGLSGTGEIAPSDTTGAAGVANVVTAVNVSYAVWSKSTITDPPAVVPPLVTGTLDSLFPTLPGGAIEFDPKVVYDPFSGRFIMAFLAGHGRPFTPGTQSSHLLLVSIPDATAGDPSTWCLRQMPADQSKGDGKQFGDYPGLGFDRNYVYVTTNQFDFGRAEEFRHAQILAIGKQSLFSCSGKLRFTTFGGKETADPNGDPAFTIMPAVTASQAGFGQTEYLAGFQEGTCGFLCGKRLTIWRIKKRGRRVDLASDQVSIPAGRMAPLGTQKDGSLTCSPVEHCWDAGDLRLVTAFYDADRDRFYTAHAVRFDIAPGDGYLEAAVRWYEVDPSPIKRASVTRTGIVGESGRDSGWPSVATDGSGNLFVNYSRAGAPFPGEYLSAALSTIPVGSTTPSASLILVPGEALYIDDTGRPQRWGDYTAINRDPVDPLDMWAVNEYARSDGSPPSTNLWQQVVSRVSA